MTELRDDPFVVRADLTIRYLELDKLTQPTCNITPKEAFDKADILQIVASVHERDAKRYEQAGNKEQQEYLLGQAEECRREAAAWYAYACEHFAEKF